MRLAWVGVAAAIVGAATWMVCAGRSEHAAVPPEPAHAGRARIADATTAPAVERVPAAERPVATDHLISTTLFAERVLSESVHQCGPNAVATGAAEPRPDAWHLKFRPLRADGPPLELARVRLTLGWRPNDTWYSGPATPRLEGDHLSLRIDERTQPDLACWMIRIEDGEGLGLTRTLTFAAPAEGDRDLGEVVLESVPLLVAGIVTDEACRPLSGVSIEAGETRPALSDASGRFAIHGATGSTAISVTATLGDARPRRTRRVRCAPGAWDLRIVLRAAATIRGSVLLPPEAPREFLSLAFVPVGESSERAPAETVQVPPGIGDFEVIVEAGRWRCELRLRGTNRPIALIPGLLVAGDDLRDPRLNPIDCRSICFFEVSARDADSNAVPEFDVDVQSASFSSTWFEGARALGFTSQHGARAVVRAHGYAPATIALVAGKNDLVLKRGPRIRLRFPSNPCRSRRDGFFLHAQLVPLPADEGGPAESPRLASSAVPELEVPLTLEQPGRYRVVVGVVLGRERGPLPAGAPVTIDVADRDYEQDFTIPVDDAAVHAAIRTLE